MSDFEKGLVLAGLLTPQSLRELEEVEALAKFEEAQKPAEKKKEPSVDASKKLYFKRVVLAAAIVSELHEEPTFGRIKFQKLVFLCEHAASMKLQDRYLKLAAGPFDNRFMHTIEREFERLKWFDVLKIKDGSMQRSKYIPLGNCDGYTKYFSSYFGDSEDNIRQIIELFRKRNTAFAEISATLFACYLEIKKELIEFTQEDLLRRFYKWSERKQQYDKATVISNWSWMQDQGLVEI